MVLLGFIYNMLQARDLLVALATFLEFFILFDSCEPTCKPARNYMRNGSIFHCFRTSWEIGAQNFIVQMGIEINSLLL